MKPSSSAFRVYKLINIPGLFTKVLKYNQREQGSFFQYFVTVGETPSKLSPFCWGGEVHIKAEIHSNWCYVWSSLQGQLRKEFIVWLKCFDGGEIVCSEKLAEVGSIRTPEAGKIL